MSTGYTRSYNRTTGDTILASDFVTEFGSLENAFAAITGHSHDGTAGEGAYVAVLADADAKNKVVIDTSNNQVEFGVEVGGAYTEQFKLADGAILPTVDNDIDLGSATFEFKDLYIDGTANIDTLAADSATITTADINGGTIDGTTIATSDITVGAGKTLDVSGGTLTLANDQISGDKVEGGTIASITLTSADINGGTIDGTAIGGTTPAAGSFTTLSSSGTVTLASTTYVNGDLYANSGRFEVTDTGNADIWLDAGTGFTSNILFQVNGVTQAQILSNETTPFKINTGGATALTLDSSQNATFAGSLTCDDLLPSADGTYDLGSATYEWQDLYIDGTAYIDSGNINALTVNTTAGLPSGTSVGTLTLQNGQITDSGGNISFGNENLSTTGTFASGAATITGDLLPGADGLYDLGASGTEWQDLWIDGTANIDSLVANTADINGGTIDGATIGASSAAAGTFSELTLSPTTGIFTVDASASDKMIRIRPDANSTRFYINGSTYPSTANDFGFENSSSLLLQWDNSEDEFKFFKDVVISGSGNGITFLDGGGSKLDHYEEATFTPTIEGTSIAGTGTYTARTGRWVRIGQLICFTCTVAWTIHTGTGNMRLVLTGMPAGLENAAINIVPAGLNVASNASVIGLHRGTLGDVDLYASAGGSVTAVSMDSAATIRVTGFYFTNG